jgi:DNA-binding MurR/RpiR family transcriptional regulator
MNVISGEITSIWKRYTESTNHNGQDTGYDNDSELFRYRPEKLNDITQQQSYKITSTAVELAKIINQGGVIYIFGCGHSHIFAEDVFYRAGGIAPVRPIFIEPLMLHQGRRLHHIMKNRMTILLSIWRDSRSPVKMR